MLEALKEAAHAFQENEVPIGAVLVREGKIIARGHNRVEQKQDATAHAEMECLRAATAELHQWRLTGTTLYCSAEPCIMCAGAVLLHRIHTLVWGTVDQRHGAHGSWVNIFSLPHPTHAVEVRTGVLAHFSADLLKDFFKKQRERKCIKTRSL